MGQRGRKSAKLLTIIGPHGLEPVQRPKPPACLSDEAAEEWRKATDAMAADYFRPETQALLEQRSRHIVWARHIAQLIEAEEKKPPEDFDGRQYRFLMQMAVQQSYMIGVLDSKLRLTQESLYDRRDERPTAKKTPWKAA
jgi:hypothetical protein